MIRATSGSIVHVAGSGEGHIRAIMEIRRTKLGFPRIQNAQTKCCRWEK